MDNKRNLTIRFMRNSALAIFILAGHLVVAQQEDWQKGELKDVEIEIINQRQIDLPKANRLFEKIPPRPTEPVRNTLQYDFKPFRFQTSQINPAIRPLRLKDPGAADLYGGYLALGYGNYASPYLEGFINSRKNKNSLVGAHAFFNTSGKGPVDGRNSGSGHSGLSFYGKTFNEYVSAEGDFGFENRTTHFYGYPTEFEPEPKDIRQSYNIVSLGASVSNSKNTKFSYKLGGKFSYLADRFKARETEGSLTFRSGYELSEESSLGINADYAIITRKDELVEADPRSLLTVNPAFVFYPVEDLRLSAGVVAAFENDAIDNKDVHAYPDLHASYPLSPSVDVVASLTGGIEKVSLQTLSRENIWVGPNIDISHTNKLLDLQAAVHTRIGNKVAVNAGFSLASLKNWYFFINDLDTVSQFRTVYDLGTVQRTNFFASVGYSQTEAVKILLRGDLYNYGTDEVERAWHRPTYKVTGDLSFNIAKKILLDVNLIMQGGMMARIDATDNAIELDPALDLNARVEYILSEKVSFFLQFNNITNNEYPVFMNYPVRGFQAMGGFTWTF